jgi:Fe2+ transport system protein B
VSEHTSDERQHFWDNPRNVKLLINVFYACCAILVVLEFFIHEHDVHRWEGLVSFYPIYGFVGIVILVLVAKVMRKLLMRPEDYYERGD